jgi:hypothetical protein
MIAVMTKVEVHEILCNMVNCGIIQRTSYEAPKTIKNVFDGIFAGKKFLKKIDYDLKNENLVCSYVALPNWMKNVCSMYK